MFYINNYLKPNDKYDLAKFMDFDAEWSFDMFSSYLLYQIPQLPLAGTYVIRKEMNRPDMLSYNLYGDTQCWWILMWYNHFLKPQDIKSGVTVRYPSLSSIETLYMNASLQQKVN